MQEEESGRRRSGYRRNDRSRCRVGVEAEKRLRQRLYLVVNGPW